MVRITPWCELPKVTILYIKYTFSSATKYNIAPNKRRPSKQSEPVSELLATKMGGTLWITYNQKTQLHDKTRGLHHLMISLHEKNDL